MYYAARRRVIFFAGLCILSLAAAGSADAEQDILDLNEKDARDIAQSTRETGQVGKTFDFRITSTNRSYNYKLRATWMTPDVIRATARLHQLMRRLSREEAEALVAEAQAVDGAVILVEIDPREGSGVIPRDWQVSFGPSSDGKFGGVSGEKAPQLRNMPALSGGSKRDYSYDQFWMVFPLTDADGMPLFRPHDSVAELTVQIYDKVGKVRWAIPASLKASAGSTAP